MATRTLPARPSLDHLKQQAKTLLRDRSGADLQACQRLREFHPELTAASDADIAVADLTWSDGLFAIAREYGFASWPRLKARVEGPPSGDNPFAQITDAVFAEGVALMGDGDLAGLSRHLTAHPDLVTRRITFEGVNYFRNPALLSFIAENLLRNEALPPNAVAVAQLLIDAGADAAAINETLGLVASGRVARESGQQTALIGLLCSHGANADSAMTPALGHGEVQAVRALLGHGAAMTLPVVAKLCEAETAERLLAVAPAPERHLALALAAQHGCVDVVRLLLEAGEDPSRYNPVGVHSHSTPLHQAALAGHAAVVELLLTHGAGTTLKDTLFQGTPAGWAELGGHTAIAARLRA